MLLAKNTPHNAFNRVTFTLRLHFQFHAVYLLLWHSHYVTERNSVARLKDALQVETTNHRRLLRPLTVPGKFAPSDLYNTYDLIAKQVVISHLSPLNLMPSELGLLSIERQMVVID